MYRPFVESHPQVANEETRRIMLQEENGPRLHEYMFFELYCVDPGCDCRRVLFNVIKDGEKHVATISYGFDRGPMQGPFLDPLNPQTDESEEILSMAKELLLNDQAYLDRLQRHYNMVKKAVGGDQGDRRDTTWGTVTTQEERWAQARARREELLKKRQQTKRVRK